MKSAFLSIKAANREYFHKGICQPLIRSVETLSGILGAERGAVGLQSRSLLEDRGSEGGELSRGRLGCLSRRPRQKRQKTAENLNKSDPGCGNKVAAGPRRGRAGLPSVRAH